MRGHEEVVWSRVVNLKQNYMKEVLRMTTKGYCQTKGKVNCFSADEYSDIFII